MQITFCDTEKNLQSKLEIQNKRTILKVESSEFWLRHLINKSKHFGLKEVMRMRKGNGLVQPGNQGSQILNAGRRE